MVTQRNVALAAIVAFAGVLFGSQALATGTIACRSPERDDVMVEINVGQLPALVPIWVRIRIEGGLWTSLEDDDGTPIGVLQAFDDRESIVIDLADPNMEVVLFEVRLFRAVEGRANAHAGTLRASGIGAYPLVCEGP